MSTLYVDDVAGQGGGTSTNLMDGLVKGRAQYNQVTPVVNDSFNVSSISDDAVGEFTATWTTGFASADYCPGGTAGQDSGETAPRFISNTADHATRTASTAPYQVGRDAGANEDSADNVIFAWGDLA